MRHLRRGQNVVAHEPGATRKQPLRSSSRYLSPHASRIVTQLVVQQHVNGTAPSRCVIYIDLYALDDAGEFGSLVGSRSGPCQAGRNEGPSVLVRNSWPLPSKNYQAVADIITTDEDPTGREIGAHWMPSVADWFDFRSEVQVA